MDFCDERVFSYEFSSEQKLLVTFDHCTIDYNGIDPTGIEKRKLELWFHILSQPEIPSKTYVSQNLTISGLTQLNYFQKYLMLEVTPSDWPTYIGQRITPWFEAMLKAGKYVPKPGE